VKTLIDIAVVDRIRSRSRFTVNYLLLSTRLNQRVQLRTFAGETTVLPSLAAPFMRATSIFPAANWLEREVWDLFGIYFSSHGDLRRILTDYGFSGNPLRKDFPLTGFYELFYSFSQGRVIAATVELSQEFRVFYL
jgi:NADH:ubiquinone oxidoreductase subunit C